MTGAPRLELDAQVRVRGGGRVLIGGVPPRLIRLTETGATALRALLNGTGSAQTAVLGRRLVESGLLHPVPGDGSDDPPVTAIVPVLDGGPRLSGLIEVLLAEGPVIVVDDGSSDDSGRRSEIAGARVIRHSAPRGPAAARNAGLMAAETDFVAFLDADCEVEPGWRRGLAGLLTSPFGPALIAPRVRSAPGPSRLARYEQVSSPLDLGPTASLVGPERRISYLPAAALLGRRATLIELGGFDESLRFGEDVDLVWRLVEAGEVARYAPSREVHHRSRSSAAALASQRAAYGGSAPVLARRHGTAAAPLRLGRHATMVGLMAAIKPEAGAMALGTSLSIVAAKGNDRDRAFDLAGIALRGHVAVGLHLARMLSREWLPISLVLFCRSRRARRALAAATAIEFVRVMRAATTPADSVAMPALRLLDHSAYAYGLWREVIHLRDLRALIPRPATRPDKNDGNSNSASLTLIASQRSRLKQAWR